MFYKITTKNRYESNQPEKKKNDGNLGENLGINHQPQVLHHLVMFLDLFWNVVQAEMWWTSAGGRHEKSEPRSVGVLSNAHGITLLLQRTKAQEPQLSMCFDVGSRVKVFWSPSGTLCPKARGLFPQHIWEQAPCVSAAWPCLSCPQKNCKCNATFQIRNVQAAADILNCWTSRIKTSEISRSSHIVYSLACMFLWHWIACNRNSKKLPRGIILRNFKPKLTCDAISVQHLQEGGMERVSPVQLAFFQTLMA